MGVLKVLGSASVSYSEPCDNSRISLRCTDNNYVSKSLWIPLIEESYNRAPPERDTFSVLR